MDCVAAGVEDDGPPTRSAPPFSKKSVIAWSGWPSASVKYWAAFSGVVLVTITTWAMASSSIVGRGCWSARQKSAEGMRNRAEIGLLGVVHKLRRRTQVVLARGRVSNECDGRWHKSRRQRAWVELLSRSSLRVKLSR